MLNPYQFSDYQDAPGVHRFDVHHQGQNVGYAQVEDQGRKGHFIDAVHVSEEHRGAGLGNQLMQQVIGTFGNRALSLHADPYGSGEGRLNQAQLESMYAKHGFAPQGEGYMTRRGTR